MWYLVALDSVFLRACLLFCSHMSYLSVPLGVCPAGSGVLWSEQAMHGARCEKEGRDYGAPYVAWLPLVFSPDSSHSEG